VAGAQNELTRRGLQRAYRRAARGDKDFTQQLRSLRENGAQIVVLGTVPKPSTCRAVPPALEPCFPVFFSLLHA
jgi:hypothetical protein